MSEWISVRDKLPKALVPVLVCVPSEHNGMVHEGFISRRGVWTSNHKIREPGEVTHWMPMPLPPYEILELLIKE